MFQIADFHWLFKTVAYQQSNKANQIHGFTIDYEKIYTNIGYFPVLAVFFFLAIVFTSAIQIQGFKQRAMCTEAS